MTKTTKKKKIDMTLQLCTDNDIPAELVAHQQVRNIMFGGRIWKAVKVLSEHFIEEAEKTDKVEEKERKKKEG
jgi:hypothetical protein